MSRDRHISILSDEVLNLFAAGPYWYLINLVMQTSSKTIKRTERSLTQGEIHFLQASGTFTATEMYSIINDFLIDMTYNEVEAYKMTDLHHEFFHLVNILHGAAKQLAKEEQAECVSSTEVLSE